MFAIRWFVEQRYLPMREGTWSPAYRKINTYADQALSHKGFLPDSAEPTRNLREPGLAQQAGTSSAVRHKSQVF
jgi:hypothetical protein